MADKAFQGDIRRVGPVELGPKNAARLYPLLLPLAVMRHHLPHLLRQIVNIRFCLAPPIPLMSHGKLLVFGIIDRHDLMRDRHEKPLHLLQEFGLARIICGNRG